MSRRSLSLVLFAVLAVQLLGGIALASECFEPCPDDTEGSSCPPVCALCTSCTHAKIAIMRQGACGAPRFEADRFLLDPTTAKTSQRASDIFHVPLPG